MARGGLRIARDRALLSAVGELGGPRAWLRFFADHPLALESLDQMGARPEKGFLAQTAGSMQ